MLYHAKEQTLTLPDSQMDYITFGCGPKPLIMIQGLSTRGIKGAALSLAYLYRMFAGDYTVYLFDRRKTNFVCSLPVKRQAYLISKAAAGLTWSVLAPISHRPWMPLPSRMPMCSACRRAA